MTTTQKNNEVEQEFRRLVMETRDGNRASYRQLLDSLSKLLKKAAVAQLAPFGRQQYAEDVLQETLLAVHLKLHTYDVTQPFTAWVRAVMKHKIIDYLRRHKVKFVSINDDDSTWELAGNDSPDIQAASHDLQKLLDTLKPPAGKIIYAMKVEGASVRELSAQYNLSENNVKVIVHRGLQKLADLIRKENAA